MIGYFCLFFNYVPKVAVLPILVFIGLEITSQSFLATARRHYAAVAIAFIPAIAKLVSITDATAVPNGGVAIVPLIRMLAGGFIVTSIIWAAILANAVDRRFARASLYCFAGAVFVLFGFIHSPVEGDKMFWPWDIWSMGNPDGGESLSPRRAIIEFAIAYLVMGLILLGLSRISDAKPIDTDEEFDQLGH